MEAEVIPLILMAQIEAATAEADMLEIIITASIKRVNPIETWPVARQAVLTGISTAAPTEDTLIMDRNRQVEEQIVQAQAHLLVEMLQQGHLEEQAVQE